MRVVSYATLCLSILLGGVSAQAQMTSDQIYNYCVYNPGACSGETPEQEGGSGGGSGGSGGMDMGDALFLLLLGCAATGCLQDGGDPSPAPEAAPISQKDLQFTAGAWRGVFYDCGECGGPVEFALNLRVDGQRLRGDSSEPNTFGDRRARRLYGAWEGVTRADGTVEFTKWYDGSGGVGHSVAYSGRFSAPGRIDGRWRIGRVSGRFTLSR